MNYQTQGWSWYMQPEGARTKESRRLKEGFSQVKQEENHMKTDPGEREVCSTYAGTGCGYTADHRSKKVRACRLLTSR